MLCIAHAFIWLPVSFIPPHRKQFIELNSMPCIAHTTKIWTVFDAPVIANTLDIFDGSLTPPFAIIASHIVSWRVSDCSVALAASCSSEWSQNLYFYRLGTATSMLSMKDIDNWWSCSKWEGCMSQNIIYICFKIWALAPLQITASLCEGTIYLLLCCVITFQNKRQKLREHSCHDLCIVCS